MKMPATPANASTKSPAVIHQDYGESKFVGIAELAAL